MLKSQIQCLEIKIINKSHNKMIGLINKSKLIKKWLWTEVFIR
jgi:hypothetical protein